MGFLVGVASGIFGGLVGIGGGVIMVPLLARFSALGQHQIHGTSLVAVVCAGLSGSAAYARTGFVDWRAVLVLAISALLTVRIGARYCASLPGWKLQIYLGYFLFFVSTVLLGKPLLGTLAVDPVAGLWKDGALLLIGLATGFIAGLLGIGGGALLIAGMVLFVGMSQHVAQGSSLLAIVPAAALGSYTHWREGNIVIRMLPGLIAGIILGAFLGGMAAGCLPEMVLRIIFALVLMWLGLDLIRQAPSGPSPPRFGGGVRR